MCLYATISSIRTVFKNLIMRYICRDMAPLTLERDIRRAIELMETLEQSGEIPASKLAAMKNVLKSDFCRAVREVYEQV